MAIKNINGNIVAQSAEDVFIPSLGVSLAEALRLRLIDIPEQYESIIQSLQQNVANILDSDSQVNSVVVKCEADSTGNIHAEGTYSKGTLTITLYNIKGEKGDDGVNGINGKSAYDLAVENGFVGTVAEWLASLSGEKGEPGTNGKDGKNGADGHLDNVVQTVDPSDTANAPSSKAVADYVAAHAEQGGGDSIEAGANITIETTQDGKKRISAQLAGGTAQAASEVSYDNGDGTQTNLQRKVDEIDNLLGKETTASDLEEICIDDENGNPVIIITPNGVRAKTIADLQGNPIGGGSVPLELANVSFIPIFGQSLSVGAAATPPISIKTKYPAAIMFQQGLRAAQKAESYFTDFQPLYEGSGGATNDSSSSGETVASGCAEQLIELLHKDFGISPYSPYWDSHKFLFGTFGAGSKTIAMLTETPVEGIGYYQGLVNAMTAAKRICDAKGWTLNIPAWIWIQGETDQKTEKGTTKEAYKSALVALAQQLNLDAKSITGQENDVRCICYQTNSLRYVANWSRNGMDVPTAQMEAIRDNDLFLASAPVYVLDASPTERIHLSAKGEKMLGNYCGIALASVISGDLDKRGVIAKSISIDGNNVIIKCNVPCPPLRIDTTWVAEIDNYGFNVKNGTTDIITDVKVMDDTITIICSENPEGCTLSYGNNGASGYDDRFLGARGNICDSGGNIYNGKIAKEVIPLSNYLYTFKTEININQ